MRGVILKMSWIENMNKVIDYIELHLTEKIDYETLASLANCPPHLFQKIFFYMTNISLSQYIRRRKMSLALIDLKHHMKVIDVALKYGYDSPTSFNRAFQSVFFIAPSAIKKSGTVLKSYSPIRFSLSLQGMEELHFKIEEKDAFDIIGQCFPLSHELEENFINVPQYWNHCLEEKILNKLIAFNNQKPYGLLGMSVHHHNDWRYFIAVSSSKNSEDFEKYHVPSSLWVVFSGRGTNKSLQDLQRRVITEWLPTSGYDYAKIPDIEVYLKADPDDAIYEYWLPVIKRG